MWFEILEFASASQLVDANGALALAAGSCQVVPRRFHRGVPEAKSSAGLLVKRCKTSGLGSA